MVADDGKPNTEPKGRKGNDMEKEKKAGDVLATADFRLVGKGWEDQPVDEKVHAELSVSGAFQYGNQTAMSFEWEARKDCGRWEHFDTRYENVSPENFKEFAYRVLRDRTMKSVAIEVL